MVRGALTISVLVVFLLGATRLSAQAVMVRVNETENEIQKYTVMEKFEPNLVIPADERKRRKDEQRRLIAQRRSVLDTLDMSDRRRQRLLRELNKNPFSNRIDRTFAEIEFEDDPDLVDRQN